LDFGTPLPATGLLKSIIIYLVREAPAHSIAR